MHSPAHSSSVFGPDFDADGHFIGKRDDSAPQSSLTAWERSIAERATLSMIQVTDVGDFPLDFDAGETIATRHLQLGHPRSYRADDAKVLPYAAHFFASLPDLAQYQITKAVATAREHQRAIPRDVVEAHRALREKTFRVLLNSAPRNQSVSLHQNGRDFHLAFTQGGVEVYACPVQSLRYIRPQLEALFQIPSNGHPLTEDGEQFRSSVFGGTAHQAPEHLKLLWRKGEHTDGQLEEYLHTPTTDEVAYKDRPFKNRRVFSPDLARTWEQIDERKSRADGTVAIRIGTSDIRAHIVKSLAGIPGGEWGVYGNPAETGAGSPQGFYEINRRYNDGKSHVDFGQDPDDYLDVIDRGLGLPITIEKTA